MNEVVAQHRAAVPQDPRDDAQLTLAYGDANPQLVQQYPQFGQDYTALAAQRAQDMKPTVGQEFVQGAQSGTDSLLATGEGALAWGAGAVKAQALKNYFLQKAQENEQEASENPPSVPSVSDIDSASDLAHYVARKAGELVPNIAESAITAAGGAIAVGMVAPEGGEVPGALYGLFETQAIKSLIRKGVIDGLEDLGSAEGKQLLGAEVKNLGKAYGTHIAETVNFWAQSAGSTYNTLSKNPDVDPGTALNVSFFGGLAQAIPAQYLPSTITKKFFGDEAAAVGPFFARLGSQAAKIVPGGAAAMSMQELASIASEKYADPTTRQDAFDLSKWSAQDKARLADASATGALAGLIGAPVAALPGGKAPENKEPNPALKNYTGNQTPEQVYQFRQIAQRDNAGELTPQDQAAINNLTPEQRNTYMVVKDEAEKQPEPEPSAQPTVEEKSDLAPVTERIAENPSPLVKHPELSDDEMLKAMEKPSEPTPQQPAQVPSASQPAAETPAPAAPVASVPAPQPAPPPAVNPVRARAVEALTPEATEMRQNVAQAAAEVKAEPPKPETPTSEKPQVEVDGIPIAMENAAGGTRTGKSGAWQVEMPAHYGEIVGSKGADGDPIDVYVVPKPEGDKVFVVDQRNPDTVNFDEHKVMLGFDSQREAEAAYDAAFSDGKGPQRRGAVTETTKNGLKEWLNDGDKEKPFAATEPEPYSAIVYRGTGDKKSFKAIYAEGTHYTTSEKYADGYANAKGGTTEKSEIHLKNPYVTTPSEFTKRFYNVDPKQATSILKSEGHDGVVIVHPDNVAEQRNAGVPDHLLMPSYGHEVIAFDDVKSKVSKRIGIDDVNFENTDLAARESKQGTRGGPAVTFEPSFFEIKPGEEKDTKALGDRLVSGSRSEDQNRAYQESKRVTAVRDNETGKVYLLSTYREKTDGSVKVADPSKVNAKGKTASRATRLEDFLSQKTADGQQKYTPLSSLRLNDTERYLVQEYPNQEAFESEVGNGARERMGTLASHAEVVQEQHDAALRESGRDKEIGQKRGMADEHDAQGWDEGGVEESTGEEHSEKEGFTADHANALWNVFGGEEEEGTLNRERFEELFSTDLRSSRKAIDAVRAMIEPLVAEKKISAEEALDIVKDKLYASLEIGDRSGKEAFKESALQKFGAESTGGTDTSRSQNGSPGEIQLSSGQRTAEQQSQSKGGDQVANPAVLSFRKPEGVQEVTGRHAALLDNIHKAAVEGGMNVQRIAQDMSGAAGDFAKKTGAAYDRASRTVAQVVSDVVGREDIVTSLHEVAHDVFTRLPKEQQDRALAAIDRMGDRQLGVDLSSDPRIRATNPDKLPTANLSEERLVEATALHLTDAGFDPAKARGFAQSFVRALKDLYFRSAMAVQRALFGDQFVNPSLALRFFENRVKQFLAGDFNRTSFIDMLGGGKPSESKVGSWHNNDSAAFERVGSGGSVNYEHVPDTSLEASSFNNLVFRRPEQPVVDDPHSRQVEIEKRAALFNHQEELIERVAAHPDIVKLAKQEAEMTPKERIISLLNLADPEQMKTGLASEIEQDGQPVQYDKNKTIDDFKSKSNQADVTSSAYQNVQALVSKVANIKNGARDTVEKLTNQREKKLERYEKEKAEYADWQGSTTEATREMRKEGNKLFSSIAGESKKQGAIEQQLRAIDPTADLKKYAPAFQSIFSGDLLKGENLFTVLDKLANDPSIDFNKPIDQIREALSQKLEYAQFVQDTNESRALTATITAFAKTHKQVMANLELRRAANGEERAAIAKRLDDLKTEKTSFLTNLKDIARTAKLEDRVRRAYRESLLEVRSLNRRIEHAQNKITAADAFGTILSKEHGELAGKLAIGADATFRDGMVYNVPPSADASREDILKATKTLAFDTGKGAITNPDEVESHLRQMSDFINARDAQYAAGDFNAKDDLYNGIKRQRDEISANKNFKVNVGPAQKLMTELNLSPAGVKIRDAFGTPAARMIDQMINRFTSEQMRMKPEAERIGRKNGQLEDKLLKLLPGKLADSRNYLRENFLNPAKRLMQHQDDLEERHAGNPNGLKTAIYNRVMSMLLNNEATREYVRGKEPQWRDGLQNLLEFQHESNKYLLDQVKASGLSVSDPRLKAVNPATGKTEQAIREHIPQGAYTFSQKLSSGFRIMVNALRNSGWAAEDGDSLARADFQKVAQLYDGGQRAQADQLVGKYFTHEQHGDQVRNQFFKSLAEMDTESPFDAPKLADGVTQPPADTAKVLEAYQRSGGNPLKFAEAMWDLHGGQVVTAEDGSPIQTKGSYIQDTMLKLSDIAQEAHNILNKVEPTGTDRTTSVRGMTANALIDARSIDHLPGQWFDYHSFDQRDTFKMIERIASQAAFGRGQERLGSAFDTLQSEVKEAQLKLAEGRAEVIRSNPEANAKAIDKLLSQKFGKDEYDRLQKFSQRARMVQSSVKDLSTYFRRDNSPDGTLQALTRASNTIGQMIINQPSSALSLLTQLVDMNLRFGASGSTIGATFRSGVAAGKEIAASLAQAVGLQIFNGGEYHRLYNELGLNDPAAMMKWRDAFDRLEGESSTAQIFRGATDILGTGLNRVGDKAQHVVLKPGQIFNTAGEIVDKAITEGIWRLVGKQVMRGMDFYQGNLDRFNDPSFKLTPDLLKLRGAEKDSFGRINQSLERWGINYDDMVRGAMQRGDKTLLSNEEAVRIYSMAMSEVALESNISTMPAAAYNNSLLRVALPLLGWSFRRMRQIADLRLNADGKRDMTSLARGMAGLSVVAAGGLATSALIDQYYQSLLGKQRNIRPVNPTDALDNQQEFALSVMEQLNRVGTLGMFGELANGIVNTGKGGDNRALSVDGRVLAVSSFQSIQQAISSWINQGQIDYSHVIRPLGGAVGAGGLIQYMQLANNALGLDNAEARVTARINAQNYLRVVGRELGMDVRVSDGGQFTPTPITPYLTNMELAAYKNDPADFREAYANAVNKAREAGQDDPVDYVKRAFSSRNPLRSVFTTAISQGDYNKLLANMPGSGQQDVSQAVRLFNQYAESIGAKAFDGKSEAQQNPFQQRQRIGLGDIRQRAALALQ